MSKIPLIKRLMREDYPDQRSWIERLISPLNTFMETVSAAMDRNLTVSDNLDCQVITVTVSTGDSTLFSAKTRARPNGLLVWKVVTLSGSDPTAAVMPVWTYVASTNSIKITSWLGLAASSKYQITLQVMTS